MKLSTVVTFVLLAIAIVLASLWMAQQSYSWLPVAASKESTLIDNLFAFTVFWGSVIFFGVTGTIGFSVLTRRVSRFDLSDGPPIEGNVPLEIIWTAVPIALVFLTAGYSYWTYEQMAVKGPMELVHLHMPEMAAYAAPLESEPTVNIDVNAKQWAWTFHYPDKNVTSAELHVPLNQRVKLALRSEDVLHGFYVPAFRLKQDIFPNRTIEFEFTPTQAGKYRINDSQFSGTFFAIMQSSVIVEPADDYDRWLRETATHKLVPAENQPYLEYTKRSKKGLKPGWRTVPPAAPPLVNQSGGLGAGEMPG